MGVTTPARAGLAAAMLLLAGCTDLPPLPPASIQGYRLGVGDEVRIITYGDERMSGTFRIGDDGAVNLPLVGSLHAQGDTIDGFATALTDTLRQRNLFANPSIAAEIVAYRPVFVLGEVTHPGQYPYQPGMTALTLAAIAGGFTYRAEQDQVTVERNAADGTTTGSAPSSARLLPGDVVTVRERFF